MNYRLYEYENTKIYTYIIVFLMYPKSPFSTNIYLQPKDDIIFNFNMNKITCSEDVRIFSDIKTNIDRISFQLYNLKISYDCCKKQSTKECVTKESDVKLLISQLKRVKQELRNKANDIMDYYKNIEESNNKSFETKKDEEETQLHFFKYQKKNT